MSKLIGIQRDNITDIKTIIKSGGRGPQGLSAYEVWLQDGNQGTVEDFFESLKGEVSRKEFEEIKQDIEQTMAGAINEVDTTIVNAEDKITDVENRFQTLTTEQQQDAEVIDARQGKTSLVANIQEFKDNLRSHQAESIHQKEVHGLRIEEGIFEPELFFTTVNNVTYTKQEGYYRRVGNKVEIDITIVVENLNDSRGIVVIRRLPYYAKKQAGLTLSRMDNLSEDTFQGGDRLSCYVEANALNIRLVRNRGNKNSFLDPTFLAPPTIIISGSYYIA